MSNPGMNPFSRISPCFLLSTVQLVYKSVQKCIKYLQVIDDLRAFLVHWLENYLLLAFTKLMEITAQEIKDLEDLILREYKKGTDILTLCYTDAEGYTDPELLALEVLKFLKTNYSLQTDEKGK